MAALIGSMTSMTIPDMITPTSGFLSSSSSKSSSSPASPSSSGRSCSLSTQRWSMECLKAIETHLDLLQQMKDSTEIYTTSDRLLYQDGQLNDHAMQTEVSFSQLRGSSTPLPYGWEQHLDLKTGEIFYIDWRTCKRSANDPRKVLRSVDEMIQELVQRTCTRPERYMKESGERECAESCITSEQESSGMSGYESGTDYSSTYDEVSQEERETDHDADIELSGNHFNGRCCTFKRDVECATTNGISGTSENCSCGPAQKSS
ncbi:hypothetical protein KP509_22G016600 [Ceratopteris richardii]|uniref:WW domain-containing protein n=1 Tax=Ceratopteris richardii TaxID=49495 RepID=A0A8T2S5M0_CERRI|nr:hypothetical protein KP509_22G016600 [Ceratopteris richardii]